MGQQLLDLKTVKRVAGLELNSLLAADLLPAENFNKARIFSKPSIVYDINGEVLFYRLSLTKGRTKTGYADIAANSAFSEPVIAVGFGPWDEKSLLEEAVKHFRKISKADTYDQIRLVAYSYPKLAFQFLLKGKEVEMLELFTWTRVPSKTAERPNEELSNFERWSFVETTPKEVHEKNLSSFKKYLSNWDEICPPWPSERFPKAPVKFKFIETQLIKDRFVALELIPVFSLFITRQLHYSTNDADHNICYELRGQLTNVWCVGASVQMLLDFYRYNYTQVRLATELGLGTLNNPNGLPYSRDNDVVTTIERLSRNALNATMNTSPNWTQFVDEIDANRPLISFIPGHSRTVAGYTQTRFNPWNTFRGLLVYDPWPPISGVITRWENFANQTYRRTFTATLTLV